MDLIRVANACAVECVRQHVGIRELGFLLEAYTWMVKWNDSERVHRIKVNDDVFQVLGSLIEPGKNRHGYRKVPVTFANGGSSANASDIPRLMISLRDSISRIRENPTALEIDTVVREFLWIHPFADGNGRTAFVLYNYLSNTLDSPLALPDYNW